MTDFQKFVAKVADGEALSEAEAAQAFDIIMSGAASDAQVSAFLMALRMRGETVDEITGAARTMRAKAMRIEAPDEAIDTCGTGGDAKGTFNISTCAALVAAGAGAVVAKHGNRSVSSKSGSADVLNALGIKLDVAPDTVAACIETAGIGFLFAPLHHSAMKHVGPIRQELGLRTIFNLLGPLANPAAARRQVIGVYDLKWVSPLAHVLRNLGSTHVWVVHGADGLDELTTTGASHVAELKDGDVREFDITPEDAGLARAKPSDLSGGDPEANAQAIRDVLSGRASPFRDVVILNAAAALIVAGKAQKLTDAAQLAAEAIDSGAAQRTLEKLISASNS
jgi:anthranilate phosphoribosyltransferase